MNIADIVPLREETRKEQLEPTVQAHKIDSGEDRLESSASRFLETTYPSNSIRNVLQRANQKLSYKDDQGGFLLMGPYGSGKSHALVTLYHLFDNPEKADDWASEWNIDFQAPSKSESIIVSSFNEDPDKLWIPVFQKAGKEELLQEVGRYPTSEIIEELIGENPFAIFFDEIETWWESFHNTEDKSLKEKNKAFLQNLFEVAKDKNRQLYVFVTLLDKSDELKEILSRTQPIAEDVSTSGDKEKIVRHRLFDRPDENLQKSKAEEVVHEYIEGYSKPISLENEKRFAKEFVESYPFHPQTLQIIGNIYEGSKDRQNVRGEMGVLANTIAEKADKTDSILLSDVREKPFKVIDRDLVGKYSEDASKRAEGISHGPNILRSILFYSLEEESGSATEDRIQRATLKPTEGMTVTDLSMSIENLVGRAHYLHKEDGHYQLKTEYNIAALIEKEKSEVEQDDVDEQLADLVKSEIFDNQAFIYDHGGENDHIPDDSEISFVVSLKSLGDEEQLKDELSDFYYGKNYRNTFIFIVPKNGGPLDAAQIRDKTKRVIAARNLRSRLDGKKQALKAVMREEKQELKQAIKNKYGYWVKWSSQGSGHTVDAIKRRVNPNIRDVKEDIRTDKRAIEKQILEEVKGESTGKKVSSLLNDFKKMRKYPLVDDENSFYSAIRHMAGEKIFVQADRGKIHRDRGPSEIKDNYVLLDPQYAPSPEIDEVEDETADPSELSSEAEVPEAEPGEEKQVKRLTQDAMGNSYRAVHNQFEMALNNDTDRIEKIHIDIAVHNQTKEQLLDFIDRLPEAPSASDINIRVEGERIEDSK